MENENIKTILQSIYGNNDLSHEVLMNCLNSVPPDLVASTISEYLANRFITNSGIAEIAKKTPQAVVSMIKCNENDFPAPYPVFGTNLYIKDDVVNWLIQNNKIARDENDIIKQEYLFGTKKDVIIVGGPGNGKSTTCTRIAEVPVVNSLRKILTGGGFADTENLIKLHFKNNSVNYVIFHYGDSANDSIPIRITEDNVMRIKDELKKSKELAKKFRSNGEYDKLSGLYVEFVLQPNKLIAKMMIECNIDILTVIDTPGIDKNHAGEDVATADIVVVMLGDRDDIEDIAEKIKNNIIPNTGTAQYIYLYNNRLSLDGNHPDEFETTYDEFFEEAKDVLDDYSDGLKKLQDELVIGTTLSACRPLDSLICVPNFSRNPDARDDFFFQKLCAKMKEAFNNSLYFSEMNKFDMDLLGDRFTSFLNKHLANFVNKTKKDSGYDFDRFIREKHGRTKSLDDYDIECNFNCAMAHLKNLFYVTFSEYKTKDYDDEQASIIRMTYLTINEGLMNRVHYGYGSHPWEDVNSPTQMICEEVLSEKIMNGCSRSYCDILQDYGIRSNSWNYVYVNYADWYQAKLVISDQYHFPDVKTENLSRYIEICHFLPSIVVQSVLSYYKINPSCWKQHQYDDLIEKIMDGISVRY